MKSFLLVLLLTMSYISFTQTDSLNQTKWSGEHKIFAEVLGSGILGSIGYEYGLSKNNSKFSVGLGIGGRYFAHKYNNMFLFYTGLKYSYLFNGKKNSINVFYNYGRAKNLYGVFKKEELTLFDYCYDNHITTSSCLNYFWYHNVGLSVSFRQHKKLGYEIGINGFRLYNFYTSNFLLPSIKVTYRL